MIQFWTISCSMEINKRFGVYGSYNWYCKMQWALTCAKTRF